MLNVLVDLYRIHSPSFKEQELSAYVQKFLDNNQITYTRTNDFQLYHIIPDTPMICAHMDQVGREPLTNIYLYNNRYISGNKNIGADDKNGVFILLNLLLKYKNTISFIFSTGEESGCNIDTVLKKIDKKTLDTIKYCIVFDRKGSSDIIGERNSYCNKDLDDDLEKVGKDFGYKSASGLISDCDVLASQEIPCANLSCGYYNPHTDYEFTDLEELRNCLEYGHAILENLTKTYSRVDYSYGWSNYGYGYGNYYRSSWKSSYTGRNYKNYTYRKRHEYDNQNQLVTSFVNETEHIYKCFICDFMFTEQDSPSHVCPLCKAKSFPVKIKEKEIEVVNEDKIFYCRLCKSFFSIDDDIYEDLECPDCGSILYVDYFFLLSCDYISISDTYGFEMLCPKCHTSYYTRHTNKTICDDCKSTLYVDSFAIPCNMVEAMLYGISSNTNDRNDMYYCPFCDDYYAENDISDEFECPLCGSMLLKDVSTVPF